MLFPRLPVPHNLSDRLCWWLKLVSQTIAGHWRKNSNLREPMVRLLTLRIVTLVEKLRKLEQAWRTGTLKPSRKRRPRPGKAPRAGGVSKWAALPSRHGWLPMAIPDCGWYGGGDLLAFLKEAETRAFVAAVPQAARHLRPLCALFTTSKYFPDYLQLPPRPPRPHRKRARRPPDTPRTPRTPRVPVPLPPPPPAPYILTREILERLLWGSREGPYPQSKKPG
jgi:hypothetical protein